MAALAKRLAEIQRAKAPGRQLHLQLLEAFAEHGQQATCSDAVDLVARLRKARDEVVTGTPAAGMSQRQHLQQWAGECVRHEGWQLLRDRIFCDGKDGLEGLSSALLSRAYNNFRHMSLTREADEVWPLVASRVGDGSMKEARELLGVWNVAPEEHLPHLDTPLEKAMGAAQQTVWRENQLLSCIARAPDQPGSKAVLWCARELERRLADLTSEDIASLVVHLDARLRGVGSVPDALKDLARQAQDELVARDGALEPRHLVGLLGSIESRDDKLWTLLRRELLASKQLSSLQVLEVCRFLQRLPGGSASEPSLFGKMTKQLRSTLATKAEPGLVTLVARNLESFVGDFDTCQSLLNAAVRLRRDLFPGALWTLFICMSDADLVGRHPALQKRLRAIGEVLELHGIQRKTTLKEMGGIGEAMRRNRTPLAKCSSKMTERFLEVLQIAEDEYRQRGLPGDAPQESVTDGQAGSAEGDGSTNYLAETQRLLVGFWAELRGLGLEEPALTEAARRICAADADSSRRLEAPVLAECIRKLEGVAGEDAEAAELRDGLVALLVERFPRLSQRALIEAADLAASDVLRGAVNAEVGRRLLGSSSRATAGTVASVASLRRGEDLDDLVAILARWAAWSGSAGPPPGGAAGPAASGDIAGSLPPAALVSHTELLVATSLPGIMRREPAAAARRLSATVQAFLAGGPGATTPLVPLQQGVHLLASPSAATGSGLLMAESQQHSSSSSSTTTAAPALLELPLAADLAFGFSALSRGALPLDVAARLWRLTGGALAASGGGGSGGDGAEAAEAAISAGRAAELWAFGLSMRHLITPSARATLRMMPEASLLEACFTHFERRPQRARFQHAQDADVAATLARLRARLADAVPAGEVIEERFAVPGSPYVADLALPGRRTLLVVPRQAHRAPGAAAAADAAADGGPSRGALGGRGRLLEAVLEAMGWQMRWMWPEEWGSEASEEPVDPQVLKMFLGIGSEDAGTSQDTV